MLQSLRNLLKDLVTPGRSTDKVPAFDAHDKNLSIAALLFHVVAADGVVHPEERDRLHTILNTRYEVNDDELDDLVARARKADGEAVDLYAFTSVLKRELSEEERILLVESLWEMVFADGELHEFEDNIVWRVAELVAVSPRDRIALKQRVQARQSQDPSA